MPPLWLLPMPRKMLLAQEEDFWHRLDMVTGEELEIGPSPPTVQLEEAGWRILWGPAVEPADKGPPLLPPVPGLMEVDGPKLAPEDGSTAEKATDKETDSLL